MNISILRNLRLLTVLLTGCLASIVSARDFVTLVRPVNLAFDAPAANETKFFPTEGVITGKGTSDKVNFLSTDAISLAVSGDAKTDVIEFYDDLFILDRKAQLYVSPREGYSLREVRICARVFESEAPTAYVSGQAIVPVKDGIYWIYTIPISADMLDIYIPTQTHIYYILAITDTDNSSGGDNDYPVSWSADLHSNISVTLAGNALSDGQSVPAGSHVNIKAIPDEGYKIESLLINNTPQTVNAGVVSVDYTVTSPVSIKVTSVPVESHDGCKVSWTVDGNGSVRVLRSDGTDITNGMNVPEGTVLTVIATPSQDYTLAELTINSTSQTLPGQGLPAVVPITVEKDVVIAAKFNEIGSEPPVTSYPVTVNYNYGGTVRVLKPNGAALSSGESVNVGTTLSVLVSPDEGYRILSLSICGHNYDVPDDGRMMAQPYVVSGNTDIMVEFGLKDGTEKCIVRWIEHPYGTVVVLDGSRTVSNGAEIAGGTELTILISSLEGYNVVGATLNGRIVPDLTPGRTVTLTHKLSGNLSIESFYSGPENHCLTVAAVSGGSIIVTGVDNKPYGEIANIRNNTKVVITAKAEAGFSLTELRINGELYYSDKPTPEYCTSYTIDSDTHITAVFTDNSGVEVVTDTDIVLEIFDLTGRKIPQNSNIQPGLYIIRDAKGIRKVRL